MSSSTQELTARIARGGPAIRGQLQRMVARLLGRHSLAVRVFKGEDGKLTPAAIEWFHQLARDNFVNGGGFDVDPRKDAYNSGKRDLALDIIQSADLDVGRLNSLKQLEREVND